MKNLTNGLIPKASRSSDIRKTFRPSFVCLDIQKNLSTMRQGDAEVELVTAQQAGPDFIKNLVAGYFDQLYKAVSSSMPFLTSIFFHVPGIKFLFFSRMAKLLKNSHFLVVYAKNLDASNMLQASKLALKAWRELESLGYEVEPMSSQSISEQFHIISGDNPICVLRFGEPKGQDLYFNFLNDLELGNLN